MKHNINMKKLHSLKHLFFWIPFLLLLTISLFLMYHAQFISDTYQNHFERQALWIGIGFFILFLFRFIKSDFLFRYSKYFYLISLALLVLVLFVGTGVNGSRAWLNLKYFNLQPSELMKLAYSLYLTTLVTQKKFHKWTDEFKFLLYVLLLLILPCILVFLEPDTGAILFYCLITLVLLWNSKIHKWWFLIAFILVAAFIGGFFYCYFFQKDFLISIIGTTFFYRVERLFSFGTGMQIENALIAIGSAPLWWFSLTEVGIYIPESPTDFVFALSSNVFGLTGNIVILLSFLILDFYLIGYIKKIKRKEYRIFGYSFLAIFIVSQLVNISMNLGLIPIIGIPLPFVSYGGSSTIVLFLYLAIIFSCNHKIKRKQKS